MFVRFGRIFRTGGKFGDVGDKSQLTSERYINPIPIRGQIMLLGSYYKSSAVLINVTGLVFENNWKSSIRKLPLMMSDFRGGWGV